MARPSRNQDQALLSAGKELLSQAGAAGITIRAVCEKAKVNPGMFNYFFQTRDNFIEKVFDLLYAEMVGKLEVETDPKASASERLRHTITAFAKFGANNRRVIRALLRGVASGDKLAQKLMKKNMELRFRYVAQLVKEAKAEGSIRKDIPDHQIIPLFGLTQIPIGFGDQLASAFGVPDFDYGTEAAIQQRIDILLRGLRP